MQLVLYKFALIKKYMPEVEGAGIEQEANEYGQEMDQALIDLVVKTAQKGSEAGLRETLKDAYELRDHINNVKMDYEGKLDISSLQTRVDELVELYGLDAEKFSLKRLKELLDAVAVKE